MMVTSLVQGMAGAIGVRRSFGILGIAGCCVFLVGCAPSEPKDCVGQIAHADWTIEQGREHKLTETRFRECQAEVKSKWGTMSALEQMAVFTFAMEFADKSYEQEARQALNLVWEDSAAKQDTERLPDYFVSIYGGRYLLEHHGVSGRQAVKERLRRKVDIAAGKMVRAGFNDYDSEMKKFALDLTKEVESGAIPSTESGKKLIIEAVKESQ